MCGSSVRVALCDGSYCHTLAWRVMCGGKKLYCCCNALYYKSRINHFNVNRYVLFIVQRVVVGKTNSFLKALLPTVEAICSKGLRATFLSTDTEV